MSRYQKLAFLLLLLASAGTSVLFYQSKGTPPTAPVAVTSVTPSFTLEAFEALSYADDGQVAFNVRGATMKGDSQSQRLQIVDPRVVYRDPASQNEISIHAAQLEWLRQPARLLFSGQVKIARQSVATALSGPPAAAIALETDRLEWDQANKVLRAPGPLTLYQDNAVLRAGALEAHDSLRDLTLVKGIQLQWVTP